MPCTQKTLYTKGNSRPVVCKYRVHVCFVIITLSIFQTVIVFCVLLYYVLQTHSPTKIKLIDFFLMHNDLCVYIISGVASN